MNEEKPHPNEALLPFLRRTKQFHALLLYAWSEIEFNTDQVITGIYGLNYLDAQAELITDWPFGKKLSFLRKSGLLTKKEYRKIVAFQEKRNAIFHRDGLEILHTITKAQKDRLMDEAVEASEICLRAGFRNAKRHLE